MSYQFQQEDYLQQEPQQVNQLPQGLNVLTILSFIGNGLQAIGQIFNFFFLPFAIKMMKEGPQPDSDPALKPFSSILKTSNEATIKQYENRYLMLVVGLLCAGICIYGALQMRKRMKAGFFIYSVGELLLPIVTLIFIGLFSSFFSFAIAILFVILYFFQRKHLTN